MMDWLRKLLSQNGEASSSRTLQAFIAVNVTAILWMVIYHSHWLVTDNVRLVMLTLIGAGATGYGIGKLKELSKGDE